MAPGFSELGDQGWHWRDWTSSSIPQRWIAEPLTVQNTFETTNLHPASPRKTPERPIQLCFRAQRTKQRPFLTILLGSAPSVFSNTFLPRDPDHPTLVTFPSCQFPYQESLGAQSQRTSPTFGQKEDTAEDTRHHHVELFI
jgi:hypothetical protein